MNKPILTFARELRKSGTQAEKTIWKYFLSRNQTGYRFLRQRIIDHYIVDFYNYELQLIIEIDGNSHISKNEKDRIRQDHLEKYGFTVIRYTENEVINNLENIKRDILHVIYCLEQKDNNRKKKWK